MARTVFITGTNSGIGRATVEFFAAQGWHVVATMRKMEHAAIFEHLENVEVFGLEVTDSEEVEEVAQSAIKTFGQIDVLVNNAGYFQMGPLEVSSMRQIRAQYETNVFGLIEVTKAFIPHFRLRQAGMVINVSSISAENGYPFVSVYASSKAAALILTEALNIELESIGASAKAILPGTHATDIFMKIDVAENVPAEYRPQLEAFFGQQGEVKGSKPEVVAKRIYEAVTDGKRDKARYFAGPDARVIPGAKRLLGQDGYFRFFKNLALNGPSPLMKRLMPQGDEEVVVDLEPKTPLR